MAKTNSKGELPQRKAARISFNTKTVQATPGANKSDYVRRSSTPADASKKHYVVKSSGVTPGNMPMGTADKDGQPKH